MTYTTMKIKLALIASLLLAGIPTQAQSKVCQKHPDWKKTECARVERKEVWIGMTGEMLLESQGAPVRSTTLKTATGAGMLWEYEKQSCFARKDGECVSVGKTKTVYIHLGRGTRVDSIEDAQ